jgi:3-methyladenine DNA glycosylase AlkD
VDSPVADPDAAITYLRQALEVVADPSQAEPMAAYMKNHFPFLGVKNPEVRAAMKPLLADSATFDASELLDVVDQCWAQPEREFQYVGALLLRRRGSVLDAGHIEDLEGYLTTKSWWDSVDSLAVHTVGPLVKRNPDLVSIMDDWIGDDNIWLARTAIIHQLMYKADTDRDRLFRYAERRADDTEFFIRKAIGWALRQYAREEPDAVRQFVADHEDRLSGLTKREALKHLQD